MTELNDIITEMSTNISSVLTNSLEKILHREEIVKSCVSNLPQVRSIINQNDKMKNIIQRLKIEKASLLKDKMTLLEEKNVLLEENRTIIHNLNKSSEIFKGDVSHEIKNISLRVSEKENETSSINMDFLNKHAIDNKIIKLNNLWNSESSDVDSEISNNDYDSDEVNENQGDILISDYWKKQIQDLNEHSIQKYSIEQINVSKVMEEEETKVVEAVEVEDEEEVEVVDEEEVEVDGEEAEEEEDEEEAEEEEDEEEAEDETVEAEDEAVEVVDETVEAEDEAVEVVDEAVESEDEAVESEAEAEDEVVESEAEAEDEAVESEEAESEAEDEAVESEAESEAEAEAEEEITNEREIVEIEEEGESDEEIELSEIYIKLPQHLKLSGLWNKKTGLTSCYTDNENTVYELLKDDDVGKIIGNLKDGIFFEC